MIEASAYIGGAVLLGLVVFQLALIAGAPIGRFAWGGTHAVLPRKLRIGSAVSIVLYAAFAAVLLSKAGIGEILPSGGFLDATVWVCTGYFFVGIFMNAISRSRPERYVMTPVALILAVTFLIVARS